jgi:hypothetical protein
MASNKQVTGMRGVYLVAAELSKHGFITSPTSRSAHAADILATDAECKRAFSVQVKTKSTKASYWLLHRDDKRFVSDSHIYVFVNIRGDGVAAEFFIIPSKAVANKGMLSGLENISGIVSPWRMQSHIRKGGSYSGGHLHESPL